MPDFLILADDLTGAADTGAQFALAGRSTVLLFEPDQPVEASVLVINSASRDLCAKEASAAVRKVLTELSRQKPLAEFKRIYKKIDSTLRGSPAVELDTLLEISQEQRVLVAPAYPGQGRTTRNGFVWIQGTPLSQTAFASEAGNGDLRQLFGENATLLPLATVRMGGSAVQAALGQQSGIILADAENNDDLFSVAQAAVELGIRVFCGSAGLAGALNRLSWPDSGVHAMLPLKHNSAEENAERRVILGVAGSLHSITIAQVAYARQRGIEILTPPPVFFHEAGLAGVEETAVRLGALYHARKPVILSTHPKEVIPNHLSSQEIGEKLARTAVLNFPHGVPVGLFLTGGDTALAVCRVMGCKQLRLGGEVEVGMPWSIADFGTLVTKAGGFGREDALMKGIDWLNK